MPFPYIVDCCPLPGLLLTRSLVCSPLRQVVLHIIFHPPHLYIYLPQNGSSTRRYASELILHQFGLGAQCLSGTRDRSRQSRRRSGSRGQRDPREGDPANLAESADAADVVRYEPSGIRRLQLLPRSFCRQRLGRFGTKEILGSHCESVEWSVMASRSKSRSKCRTDI